jgi:hypothetical protein
MVLVILDYDFRVILLCIIIFNKRMIYSSTLNRRLEAAKKHSLEEHHHHHSGHKQYVASRQVGMRRPVLRAQKSMFEMGFQGLAIDDGNVNKQSGVGECPHHRFKNEAGGRKWSLR